MGCFCQYCDSNDGMPCLRCGKYCCSECSLIDTRGNRICTDFSSKHYTRCAREEDYNEYFTINKMKLY